jgi:hypothetical protein
MSGQLALSIATSCRCAQPDCPTCTGYVRARRYGSMARIEEGRASSEQHRRFFLIFSEIRVAAHLLSMSTNHHLN